MESRAVALKRRNSIEAGGGDTPSYSAAPTRGGSLLHLTQQALQRRNTFAPRKVAQRARMPCSKARSAADGARHFIHLLGTPYIEQFEIC